MARVTRPTDNRIRAPQEPEPWPDEPPAVPATASSASSRGRGAGDGLPAGWELVRLAGPPVYTATFGPSFARAIVRDPDGRERAVILRRIKPDSPGAIIWEGDIRILGRYSAFEITPGRVLKSGDWSDYLIVESVNRMGISSNPVPVAAMDLNQTKPKAQWLDRLKVALTGRASYIGEFIRASGENWERPSTLMIAGQGPVWLRDGSPLPNKLLDHSLVFISRSRSFDARGESRDVTPDLSHIPEECGYYDLTPEAEITPGEITQGIARFRSAYGECPGFPAIPAAFLGQLFTGSLAAINPRYFTAILQTGSKGSGKTRYAARWDAVQSRNSRDIHALKPVLNLGDNTGTLKGPKYNIANFGGYSVTVDDVLKDGNSPAQVTIGSEHVSNLIRSYDNGGAPLAGVDYTRNKVVARKSPALHSSIRVLSEIPISGDSTLDRMLVMPHIGEPWGRGNVFNVEIASRLTEPAAIEDMHRAYSAFVQWLFRRIDTDAADARVKALAETGTWGIDSRFAERYAAAVMGHYLFAQFCAEHESDITAEISGAIAALRECARAQATGSVPLGESFMSDFRRAVMLLKVSVPGPPKYESNGAGMMTQSYSVPYTDGEPGNDNGVAIPNGIMPGNNTITYADLGMISEGGKPPVVPHGSFIAGFSLPPRADKGGKKGSPLTRIDHVACKKERFAELCQIVSRVSGRAYEPKSVMDSLRTLGRGDIMRVSGISPKQEWAWVFDLVWALKPREE